MLRVRCDGGEGEHAGQAGEGRRQNEDEGIYEAHDVTWNEENKSIDYGRRSENMESDTRGAEQRK